jgi:hypothetical protein
MFLESRFIYVLEDKVWAIKGDYEQAMEENDPVQWEKTPSGNLSLSILAVS